MKLACAALLVFTISIASGCDDDDDVAADIPGNVDGGSTAPPAGSCDPVGQDCPTGQQCTAGCNVVGVMAKVFTCAVPNAGASATNGQDCGVGCAPGNDCFVVAVPGGGTRNVCRKYCNTDADCPDGRTCTTEGVVCTAGDANPIGRVCTL